KALSVQKMVAVTNNSERTRASYYGVIENHYDTFGQTSMYKLSSNSTIDISEFVEEPTVIVIQSGNTKIGDDLIALLMNELYTYVVKKGKEVSNKRLPRKIHCFLDEFANSNIFTAIVGFLYTFDTPTGVCPSLHVAYSLGIASAWVKEKGVSKWWKSFVVFAVIMICLSTMFIKQHSAVDFFAALPVCLLAEIFAFGGYWKEKFKKI
ncbi:MAG: type IV secretory system conjugative DNA transfer family protein, partial [Clostridia bacterium]|nr:type IV secretory system conjugative DNA transfer family protein [Clostridia bacterium]